ncbi:MAG: polysaccharide deacetylase family protein [Thermoplasmata archaeon]|nr:polysaccharide deacetylase family protein [Thermoplasmata archaeon]
MKTSKRTYIALTIDVDPDVNVPVETQISAVSYPPEEGKVRFESCQKGLRLLTGALEQLNIEATFFYEGRTAEALNGTLELSQLMEPHEVGCHSWGHEDFTANAPDLMLAKSNKLEIITKSLSSLKTIFTNHNIIGFRAPYTKIDIELAIVLEELGFIYDSSATYPWGQPDRSVAELFKPRPIKGTSNRILELPLPLWRDAKNHPISSYLWQFLESERGLDEYLECILKSAQTPNDEIIILGTHPWHIVETYNKGKLNNSEITQIVEHLTNFLNELKAIPNAEFIRLDKYLEKAGTIPTAIDLDTQKY